MPTNEEIFSLKKNMNLLAESFIRCLAQIEHYVEQKPVSKKLNS